jgi:predicted transcriptional regulator
MENDKKSSKKRRSADCEIEIQQWQIEHIQASIKQADAGRLIDHEQVRKMAARSGDAPAKTVQRASS